jgi:LacI family transcriptional regulator
MIRATLEDVAAHAGVSIKTVSRVVNKEPNVRQSTMDKVSKAIAELNYRPNLSARNLASQRSHLIGLIYDDPSVYELPSAGYIINMQEGVLRACRAHDYDLLIHPCRYRERSACEEINNLITSARPDGIVVAAPLSNVPRIIRAIETTNTPLVCLSPGKQDTRHNTILTNDQEISAQMVEYLVKLGHKRIAFIAGDPEHKAVANRLAGYRQAIAQAGLNPGKMMVFQGDNSIGSGESAAEKILAAKSRPTAIFAANDDMAVGVLRAAARMGISVPGELSVAGFDDIALARQVYPTLTTVSHPLVEMAEHAAQLLIETKKQGRNFQRVEIIPGKLQIRESTGPCPQQ